MTTAAKAILYPFIAVLNTPDFTAGISMLSRYISEINPIQICYNAYIEWLTYLHIFTHILYMSCKMPL